jgi:hypothetical protein
LIFADGASFKKTGYSGKAWAIYAILMDLGPKLRGYFNNI